MKLKKILFATFLMYVLEDLQWVMFPLPGTVVPTLSDIKAVNMLISNSPINLMVIGEYNFMVM
jgi:hypothetical protein